MLIICSFENLPEPSFTLPVAETKVKPKSTTKKQSSSRKSKERTFINTETGETITCAASKIIKEDSPLGIQFSRGDRDAIVYYNKVKHGWKLKDDDN